MRLIDADALIMALRLEYPMMPMFKENQKEWGIKTEGYRKAEEVIKDAPTIEPKRGEWKKVKNVHAWDVSGIETWGVKRKCTNCDFRHTFIEDHGHYNFCPNCGADMRGADQ